jgi:hypothetical protein
VNVKGEWIEPPTGNFSVDLRLGGDYGTALFAAVANRRHSTVRFLVTQKVNLKAIGRVIQAGRQIPLMTIRTIRRCISCRCDARGRENDRTAGGYEFGRGRLYM